MTLKNGRFMEVAAENLLILFGPMRTLEARAAEKVAV